MEDFNKELEAILKKKAKGFYYTEETVEFTETASGKSVDVQQSNNGIKILGLKRKRGRPKKICSNTVTFLTENEKPGVDLGKKEESHASKQENVVVKRKITTHYVPPDMLAIKMLLENFGEKIEDVEKLSDEELIKMKKEILQEWEKENAGK